MRTCVVCRRRTSAVELVRVRAGGRLGPGPGRGAWLCRGQGCVTAKGASTAVSRALRAPVTDVEWERVAVAPAFT